MLFVFLLSKVLVWLLFWTLRYTPVVGVRLSNAYGDRVFSPVADDIEVGEVTATTAADGGTELRFAIENGSWVDIDVDGLDVRVGRTEGGATVRNISWPPAFERPPKNVDSTRIESESAGSVAVEFLGPAADRDRGTANATEGETAGESRDAERTEDSGVEDGEGDDAELHVDGSFVFEYSFEVRGHRFSFGDRSHALPPTTVNR
ncbi:hypothetical protein ACFQE1_17690 [Halobium palmae]|uniref:Uncharacterized protein n=1 Tax=Halobium palmae TaxID=1776492 RepID=A0ABD5S4J2_9EURY